MTFNIQQARADGHTDGAIAGFLAAKHGFDLERARADGIGDTQVAEFLAARPIGRTPAPPATTQPVAPAPEKSLARRSLERVSDVGLDLAKGVVGLGEGVVGVADLVTGNLAGEGLAAIGYDPKRTKSIIESGYSDARKAEQAAVQRADGFVDTTAALIENPATAVGAIVESAPLMLGSAGAVRAAATQLLTRAGIAPGTRAAAEFLKRPEIVARLATVGSAAEGATAAGSIQEQARQEGRTWSQSAPYAVAGGAGTAAIGKVASRILPDVDVSAGTLGLGAGERITAGQAAKQIGRGIVQEGIVEELPQSAQEQVATNLATGRPFDEGVGSAAAQGMIAGMGMGAGATGARAARDLRAPVTDATTDMEFSPEQIEAAARAALDPARAQREAILQQREAEAFQRDPLDGAVTQLENDAIRAQTDATTQRIRNLEDERFGDQAAIDQEALLDEARNAPPTIRVEPEQVEQTPSVEPQRSTPLQATAGTGYGAPTTQGAPIEQTATSLPSPIAPTVTPGAEAEQQTQTIDPDEIDARRTTIVERMDQLEAVARARAERGDATGLPSYGASHVEGRVSSVDWMTQGEREQFEQLRQQLPSPGEEREAARIRIERKQAERRAAAALTPQFRVVTPDGRTFGTYSEQHDAEGALARAGAGARVEPIKAAPVERERADAVQPLDVTPTKGVARTDTTAPMLMTTGKPFRTAKLAMTSAKQRGLKLRPVEVAGGWGLAPLEANTRVWAGLAPGMRVKTSSGTVGTLHFSPDFATAYVTPDTLDGGRPNPDAGKANPSAKGVFSVAPGEVLPADRPTPQQVAPAPAKHTKKPRKPDGRAALLEQIEQAKQRTGDPAAIAEYRELTTRIAEARRTAALKKTKPAEARKLTSWADNAEAELERLRERIGFVRFKSGSSRYRVLATPENLSAFARKVRTTAAFRTSPTPWEAIYDAIDIRPDSTEAQLEAGRSAIRDLFRRVENHALRGRVDPENRSGITVLGSGLYEGFAAPGGVRLTGQRVENPADLAALAQVFRDPRFETFRVFYTDDQGVVIGEAGYSSRLPAAVFLPNIVEDVRRDAAAYKAAGYYVLHNHPSGRSAPSAADLELTRQLAAAVPGFRSHVVIDHNEYSTVDASGNAKTIAAPELANVDFHSKPELEHRLLGTSLTSPKAVADLAKALQIEGGHATIVFTRRAGEVQLIVDLPAALLGDDSKVGLAKLKGVVRRAARAVGAGGHRFVVLPDGAQFDGLEHLVRQGVFADVVTADGVSMRDRVAYGGDFLDQAIKPAARVAEPYNYETEHLDTAEAYGGRGAWEAARAEGRTKLNYRQWVQVRTPAFKSWFGDWENGLETEAGRAADPRIPARAAGQPEARATASNTTGDPRAGADPRGDRRVDPVALDPDTGEPRVFFHGTGDDVAAFDFTHLNRKDAGWLGRGAYVTSDDFIAETYARIKVPGSAGPNVMPVFVRSAAAYPATLEDKQKLSRVSQDTVDEVTRRMRAAGFDAAHLTFPDGTVELATFAPENIKSATGNSGAFDPLDADIVAEQGSEYGPVNEERPDGSAEAGAAWRTATDQARRGDDSNMPHVAQQGQPYNPAPPDETLARRLQRRWQDKFNRFTVVQDWLKAQGVALSDQANAYRAEERMHGRTATQIEDFRTRRVQPTLERIRAAGFSMAEVADFLHAQHAEERNAQIARINSEMPDGGSGMTTAEARAKLAQYATQPELVRLANELRAITDDTRRLMLDGGIITKEMSDAWSATYQHYTPLKGGPDEDAAAQGTGKGLTVKNRSKRALGHGTREEWIVENILRDHERAILQVEKNRVGQSLLKLALEAANPDLITIGEPVKRKVLRDAKTFEVRYHDSLVEVFHSLADAQRFVGQEALKGGRQRADFDIRTSHDLDVVMAPSPVLEPSETQVYVAGHAIRVQFKDELLARAWNNMGAEHMNVIFRMARGVNAWLSKAYTGYNPEFLGVNILRDLSTGVLNLSGEEGARFAAATLKNYPKAFGELLRYAFTGNASNWIKQYRADGGTTGAAYLSDLERIGANVEAAYDEYAGAVETMRNHGPRRAARAAARKTLGHFVGWIEKLNQAGENAMRLAAYRTAVETGQSRAKAAALAKNSTVNFNRKGELGQMVGALYLFFNPAVQGSASIAHALFRGKHKRQAQALTAGLIGLGYLIAATRGGGDEDEWEKLGEFTKERFVPIRTPDGWAKVPIPYGYGFFTTLGRQLRALEEGADPQKVALHLASNFVGEFSVWGAAADDKGDEKNILFLLPTIPQIVASPLINRTSLGSPIFPESKFDETRPDNLKMWRSTQGTAWHHTAETLNAITGGSAAEKGWLDVSPETLRFLWNTATGGTGRFITDSAALAWNLTAEGLPLSDIEAREVPLVRKFVQRPDDIRGARARFWSAAEEAREAAAAFGRASRIEDHAERTEATRRIDHEQREIIALGRAVDKYTRAIAVQRDAVDATRQDESKSLAYRRQLIERMEREEAQLYDQFVAQFKRADAQRKQRLGDR